MTDEDKNKKEHKGSKNPFFGRTHSEETRQKLRDSKKGVKLSREHKAKISESLTGSKNPFFGRTHSEETKQKIREKNRGKPLSEETKAKMSLKLKGQKRSLETRKRISEGLKGKNNGMYGKPSPFRGKKHSKETREKISMSRRGKLKGEMHPLFGKVPSIETRKKISQSNIGRKSWNEGKTKHSNHSLLNMSKKMSLNRKTGRIKSWNTGLTKFTDSRLGKIGEKIQKNILKRFEEGRFWSTKQYCYKGVVFRSSWEEIVAKWLDERSILWEYESKRCQFSIGEKKTIVDFYLPELDKYIEVKGRWKENDIKRLLHVRNFHKKDVCIIDRRNIREISLNLYEVEY